MDILSFTLKHYFIGMGITLVLYPAAVLFICGEVKGKDIVLILLLMLCGHYGAISVVSASILLLVATVVILGINVISENWNSPIIKVRQHHEYISPSGLSAAQEDYLDTFHEQMKYPPQAEEKESEVKTTIE